MCRRVLGHVDAGLRYTEQQCGDRRTGPAFASIGVANDHTCDVTASGMGYCWGANFAVQLGDGTVAIANRGPVMVTGNPAFTAVVVGGSQTCAETPASAWLCWGSNYHGEVGIGDPGVVMVPTPVSGSALLRARQTRVPH